MLRSVRIIGPSGAGQPALSRAGAATLLVIPNVGAASTGMAGSIRELCGTADLSREWAVGLRPVSYLGSKIVVSALICVVQATVLGSLGLPGRDLPRHGLMPASVRLELISVLAATAVAATMAGLLAGSLARRSEHTMSVLVVSVMAQLVLSGGLYGIGDRSGLQALAVLSPTRPSTSALFAYCWLPTRSGCTPAPPGGS